MLKNMNRRVKMLLAFCVCAAAVFAMVVYEAVTFSPTYPPNYWSGEKVGYPLIIEVQEELRPYINITLTGSWGFQNSAWATNWETGRVCWIRSEASQDPFRFIENIHLLVYSRLDSVHKSGDLTIKSIGIHTVAYAGEFVLPSDVIDHSEVVIPKLGFDVPYYAFSFNCSVKT